MRNQLPLPFPQDPHVDEAQVRGSHSAALLTGCYLRGCGQDRGIAVEPDVHGFVVQLVIFARAGLQIVDVRSFGVGVATGMCVGQIVGQYLFQSHESSRAFFKNSTPELDLLVELAKTHAGCLGARLTGGGFGGATINLVRRDQVEEFMRTVAAQYEQRTGRKTIPMLCQIVDGAR